MAHLVKVLEEFDIGRPSTYASIIRTIEERGYVEKEARALKPTDTGDVVSTFLEQNFMQYINDSFTAEMEDSLDDIALGKRDYVKTLSEFYIPFSKEIKSRLKQNQITINNEIIKSDIDLNVDVKCIEVSDLICDLIKEDSIFSIQMKIFGFENLFNCNIDNKLTKKLNQFLLIRPSKKEMFLLKKLVNIE